MSPYRNRYQFGLTLLTSFFLLATLFAVLLYAFLPPSPAARGPFLLTVFVAILLGTLVAILLLLRRVLRPYHQLVGEAEKASAETGLHQSKDEATFVLETFQSVVAQLQEQRTALEQLSKQASKRADSAERFSERIVASVPSALIAFDAGGKAIAINPPGRTLLGVDGEALGQPVVAVLQTMPQLAEMVADCLHTGRLYRREEIEIVNVDQHSRRVGATIAPLDLTSDDGPRGALCLLTDITEVTQLREQVALKKNLESLGEMSAGLAHEFKNAIATLHGYVQLLQSLDLEEKAQGAAASLLNEVRNLSDMVTSFLNFARPQPLQVEEIDLGELIDDCANELAPLFNAQRVEVALTGTTGVSPDAGEAEAFIIHADERMLRQALLNLIRNAVEAIPESQADRRVEVSRAVEQDDSGKGWAVVEIRDTGHGIPAADRQRIFIPFFTTKATGHGVGLALAHRVITQHGGTLTAANQKQGGAVFSIRLPR
jgi:nitrogen fixation/metabolism regulation signal transduction histidine kinase